MVLWEGNGTCLGVTNPVANRAASMKVSGTKAPPREGSSLPQVCWWAFIHLGFYLACCLCIWLAAFHLPDMLILCGFLYPCPATLLSAVLFFWALGQLARFSRDDRPGVLWLAAVAAAAVPVLFVFFTPQVVNGAVRLEAARTAPLTEFQAWSVHLLDNPPEDRQDDNISGNDPKIPENLRGFTRHFMVSVERDARNPQQSCVEMVAGGGLLEAHIGVFIGRPGTFVEEGRWCWKWADGMYFKLF
jgi:hypothetical protein